MDNITEINLGDIGRVLKAHGRRPRLTPKGWEHMCVCGGHKNDDRTKSARAWIDDRGKLGVVCWGDGGDSKEAWKNLMQMIRGSYRGGSYRGGPRVNFKRRTTRHSKEDNDSRRDQARAHWRNAFPMPARHDAPSTLWMDQKSGFYGRAPGGIRWEPKVGREGMVGSAMALLAPPSAWREAYPNLPEPSAIQRISINADGIQVDGLRITGGWINKRSDGPMTGSVVIFGLSEQCGTVRVAEGIGDALAVHGRWQQETWATCGTPGFKNKDLAKDLAQYEEVIIHSDAGEPGERAANILRDNIREAGGFAQVCPPASGSDPADARGEIAGVADAAPGGAMEVKWGDLSPTVVEAAIGENGLDHMNKVTKSVFPLPDRPMELWCEAPYTVNSDLPKGEKYKGPGDCGECLPCLEWWRLKKKEMIRLAGGVRCVLTARTDSLSQAVKWRERLGRLLSGRTTRVLDLDTITIPNDGAQSNLLGDEAETVFERDVAVVKLLICYDPTEEEIEAAGEELTDKQIDHTWTTEALSADDLDDILPWRKTIEDENGREAHTISVSRSMPKLGRVKERNRYTFGDPEYVDELLNRDQIEPLPTEYEKREKMPIPGRGDMLNAADRMARVRFNLNSGDFLDIVDMIAEGEIANSSDLKTPLTRMCSEYGGSRLLIYDCAEWRAGIGTFRPAYAPVLERVGLLTRRELVSLGVETGPCRTCGSKYCAC